MVVTVKFGPDINVLKAIKNGNFSINTEIEPALHQAYHALCIYTRTHAHTHTRTHAHTHISW